MGIDSSVLGPWCVNIVSQVIDSGRQLALAVDLDSPTGEVVVAPLDPEQPSQLWLPLLFSFLPEYPQYGIGTVFVNVLSGLALTYPGSGDNSPVQQSPLLQLSTGRRGTSSRAKAIRGRRFKPGRTAMRIGRSPRHAATRRFSRRAGAVVRPAGIPGVVSTRRCPTTRT